MYLYIYIVIMYYICCNYIYIERNAIIFSYFCVACFFCFGFFCRKISFSEKVAADYDKKVYLDQLFLNYRLYCPCFLTVSVPLSDYSGSMHLSPVSSAWQWYLSVHIWEDPGDGAEISDPEADQPHQDWAWTWGTCPSSNIHHQPVLMIKHAALQTCASKLW